MDNAHTCVIVISGRNNLFSVLNVFRIHSVSVYAANVHLKLTNLSGFIQNKIITFVEWNFFFSSLQSNSVQAHIHLHTHTSARPLQLFFIYM